MAHRLALLGEAAQHGVANIVALAADATHAPHRLGHAVALLTGDGQRGAPWHVVAPFAGLLLGAATAAFTVNRLLTSRRNKLAALRPPSTAPFARGLAHALVIEAAPIATYAVIAAGGVPVAPASRSRSFQIIDMPLKAKLYQINPGVKVFRSKVQKQFKVHNEAYRLIEDALKEKA